VAAGNENSNVSTSSPANCAQRDRGRRAHSSARAPAISNYGTASTVAAPGYSILSTINKGTTTPGAEGYATYSGTSMATPHVAGVVALMQAYASTPKTPAQIEALLKSTARRSRSTPSQPIGAGIVDARARDGGGQRRGSTPPPSRQRRAGGELQRRHQRPDRQLHRRSSDSDGSIASRSWNFGDGSSSTAPTRATPMRRPAPTPVTETVTDNAGASNSKSASVTVARLERGAARCSATASAVMLPGGRHRRVSDLHAGGAGGQARSSFTISGGTGDADLYVRSAARRREPLHCRPYSPATTRPAPSTRRRRAPGT
jgi:serine protease